MNKLNELKGRFWTVYGDLTATIRQLGFDVEEANKEYIIAVSEDEDGEEEECFIELVSANNTFAISEVGRC